MRNLQRPLIQQWKTRLLEDVAYLPKLKERLFELIVNIWKKEQMPQDWKDANITAIFKKGSRRDCGNYLTFVDSRQNNGPYNPQQNK